MYSDKTLTCADCDRNSCSRRPSGLLCAAGFTEPRRCASCRASRKPRVAPTPAAGRRATAACAGGGYSASAHRRQGGYGGGGYRDRGPREDVLGHLLDCGPRRLRSRSDLQRQARLLRDLPEHPRRLIHPLRRGPTGGPPNQRCPTRVVSRPGSIDSRRLRTGLRPLDSRRRRRLAAQQPQVELALSPVEQALDVVGVGQPDERDADGGVDHVATACQARPSAGAASPGS